MNESVFKAIKFGLRAVGEVSPSLSARMAIQLFSTPPRVPRPEWEVKLAATGKPIVFKNGLHALEWGKGATVLLVHGWQGRGTQLGALVEPLLKAGFRVVALDGPAHGESPGKRTNIGFFAKGIREVCDELSVGKGVNAGMKQPVHAVVAHSLGAGATVMALADGLKLERVVLVATPSDLQVVIDHYKRFMEMKPKVADEFQKQLELWMHRPIKTSNITEWAKRLSTPALVVHDPEDKEVSYKNAEIISKVWPKTQPETRLYTLSGVGHRRILKAPEFLAEVEKFLS